MLKTAQRHQHLTCSSALPMELLDRCMGVGWLTKMPSQEADAKSAECSVASPKPWSGTSRDGSASLSTSVNTSPLTLPVPYFIVNWPPVSCCQSSSPISCCQQCLNPAI